MRPRPARPVLRSLGHAAARRAGRPRDRARACGGAATPAGTGSRPPPSPSPTGGPGPTPTPTCSTACSRARATSPRSPPTTAAAPRSTRGRRWWSGRCSSSTAGRGSTARSPRARTEVADDGRSATVELAWRLADGTTGRRRRRGGRHPDPARCSCAASRPRRPRRRAPSWPCDASSTSRLGVPNPRLSAVAWRHGRVPDPGVPPRVRGVLRGHLRAPRGRRRGHPGPHRRPADGVPPGGVRDDQAPRGRGPRRHRPQRHHASRTGRPAPRRAGRAPPPPRRALPHRHPRPVVGRRPPGGRQVGAHHLRAGRGGHRPRARQPHHLPARQPDPGGRLPRARRRCRSARSAWAAGSP